MDVSSDEEIEPINVFQQAAKARKMRRRSPELKSPRRSPMQSNTVISPARKARRIQSQLTQESAMVLDPPESWPRPAGSPSKPATSHPGTPSRSPARNSSRFPARNSSQSPARIPARSPWRLLNPPTRHNDAGTTKHSSSSLSSHSSPSRPRSQPLSRSSPSRSPFSSPRPQSPHTSPSNRHTEPPALSNRSTPFTRNSTSMHHITRQASNRGSESPTPSRHLQTSRYGAAVDQHEDLMQEQDVLNELRAAGPKLSSEFPVERRSILDDLDLSRQEAESQVADTSVADTSLYQPGDDLLMPSSDALDSKQLDAIALQLSAGQQLSTVAQGPPTSVGGSQNNKNNSNSSSSSGNSGSGSSSGSGIAITTMTNTISFQEYAAQEGFLAEKDIELPELTSPPSVTGPLSRIEKVQATVLANAVFNLHTKMQAENKALRILRNIQIDKYSRPALTLDVLWEHAQHRAEYSGLQREFKRLRDLRIELMQMLNDLKHEQSQEYARYKAYAQLREQLEEAQTLVDEYTAAAAKAEKITQNVKQAEKELETGLQAFENLEAKRQVQISKANALIMNRANVALDAHEDSRNGSTTTTNGSSLLLSSIKSRVAKLETSMNVRISCVDHRTALISARFLTIRIDLETGQKHFSWAYPAVCREVFNHYAHIIESRSRQSVQNLLTLWNKGLAVHKAFVELLKRGPLVKVEAKLQAEITDFELLEIAKQRTVPIHLQGENVVYTTETFPELQHL